ncbi:hypothetical protein BGZ61DRAFT_538455 [Ilyonectria robusta]|uniref:uncharacterized protein n=1 Tax=Ilyonectria robusta TaxID=1079257 RepID=UPI001E8CB68F|nr:uncharacterized protein BGZ61DRAFT_538455 [Ilyonectria robusta]KAH8666272.1 hypothetical protein BGZ61DRAFT_538455 [Ilyonectria robusta]
MAEALGIAAGAVGFVSLLVQVTSGINKLRDITNSADAAPAELDSLMRELDFLVHVMREANAKAPSQNDVILQHCQANCDQVVRDLEVLNKMLATGSKRKVKGKVFVILAFRHWKGNVEVLHRNIQAAKLNLIMLVNHRTSVRLDEIALVNRLHISPTRAMSVDGDGTSSQGLWPTASANSSNLSSVSRQTVNLADRPRFRRRGDCLSRFCSCICHRTERTSRRFWALEHTPLSVFQQICDKESCNVVKHGGTFRFALSQLGIRWAMVIQLYFVTTSGKYSLRSSFEVERVVPYTSPGFEIMWNIRENIITFEEGREALVHLHRTDPTFPNHVDPSGTSYIENLVIGAARGPVDKESRYKLLELFMGEFKMTRGTEHSRFLSHCAGWIGEGPHLELLEILLHLDFEAAEIDIHDWPKPCSPDWWAPDIAPDPFFVEYLGLLSQNNQGFAGMTPLHEAVLFDSPESVRKWTSRSNKDERNAFGQTPLHLAIANPQYLRILIQAGYELDARDNYGITPLMYAAATNKEEAVMALVDAGSDLSARDTKWKRNFMCYAALRQHWKLILNVLNIIEDHAGKRAAESWSEFATYLFLAVYPDTAGSSGVSLDQLLAKCGTVNLIYDASEDKKSNCLLHDVRSPTDFEVLLGNGFKLVNHVNSAGQHPAMVAANRCNSDLVSRLLAYGTDINLKDVFHKTSLCYVLQQLEACFPGHFLSIAMDTLRVLLTNDADVLSRDNCRCPCSPQGCLPSAMLSHSIYQVLQCTSVPIWSLEWLSLVSEHRGDDEAKTILQSFIRRAKHAEMGMTHVCCQREQGFTFQRICRNNPIPDDDIDDIIDEESEFIDILDSEMNQSSKKEYNALLDDWMVQIKTSLDKVCSEAAEQNEGYEPRKAGKLTTNTILSSRRLG